MSLAGLAPGAMSVGAWAGGILFGLYLIFCAVMMARAALRDRPLGNFTRILLISCAVGHGLLGAFAVGLVGWAAFAAMMVVLAMIVMTLVAYAERETPAVQDEAPPAA